ncbi:Ran-specific GTPase-activating protein 30 [Tieghemiomyces parasiticus]|uniref:Ran-specific GTPase-activating protein 30 n=1 Tax=Tieghemiomyces parasiticus TaxID=78921 RepID=A0A9W8DQ60_9FUNG|nr:Ran-specific GTPase-activating protein 30 [Tieghemiomyces parasiticus]
MEAQKFTRFIQDVPTKQTQELEQLRAELELRLRLVVPAIDLIDILAARGNSSLLAVVPLTTDLRRQTELFARHLERLEAQAAAEPPARARTGTARRPPSKLEEGVEALQTEIRRLLDRIAEMVPFLNLALTTSGAHLSASLPASVSPARLLHASTCLQRAVRQDTSRPTSPASTASGSPPDVVAAKLTSSLRRLAVEVEPQFDLILYSLFTSSVRDKSRDDFTWKEDFARCRAYLQRVHAAATPFYYELVLIEDLHDGRYHDDDEDRGPARYGERRVFPVADLVRLHYSSSGRLLGIEEANRPVLVLQLQRSPVTSGSGSVTLASSLASLSLQEGPSAKRGDTTPAPRPATAASPRFEWLALQARPEAFTFDSDDDDDEETVEGDGRIPGSATEISDVEVATGPSQLSLLEYLLRLAALEMSEQQNHLDLPDEKLTLYLRDDPDGGGSAPAAPGGRLNGSGNVTWDLEGSIRKSYSRAGTPYRPDYGSPLTRRMASRSDSGQDSPLRGK